MENKVNLKIWFTDFWPGFDPKDNFFTNLLSHKYNLIFSSTDPEIIFYSTFGTNFLNYDCVRFFFTGEQITPNLSECDYALSFDKETYSRKYRLPLYLLYGYKDIVREKPSFDIFLNQNRKFCNFVFSNGKCKKRNEFFKKLSRYKRVDSGGRFWNNIGRPVDDKKQFLSNYKFTIAFENESYPGYTTEKIIEPMLVNSLPIYWGNPLVHQDFNTKSFLNYSDFRSEDELIEKIIFLDKNDQEYKKYYEESYLINNSVPEKFKDESILNFLEQSINTGTHAHSPVSKTKH